MLSMRKQYDMTKHGKFGVLRFIDELLKLYSTVGVCEVYEVCQELIVPVKQVKETEDPQVRLRELQLQAICRLIQMIKKEEKNILKEIHSIFSSIALLCDTLAPPCIMDEDAVTPFRCFLQHDIASRFSSVLPKTTTYLLSVFELIDKSNENSVPRGEEKTSKVFQVLQQEYVFRQRSTEHARPKTDSKKLLSQFLHQEKYPKKKSLCESDDPFKEMLFQFNEKSRRSFNLQMNTRRSESRYMEKKHQYRTSIFSSKTVTRCDPRNKLAVNTRKTTISIIPIKQGVGASTHRARGDTKKALPKDEETTNYSRITRVPNSGRAIISRTPERPLRNPPRKGRIVVESSPPLRQSTH